MSKSTPKKDLPDLPVTNGENVRGGMTGINRLIAVTQMKAANANDDA